MEVLPDDALLEVMQYLEIPDLLACRLVCRRLVSLALRPELWRHQSIEIETLYTDEDIPRPRFSQCAVLRLAPCLRDWHVYLPKKYHTMFATTRCAVNKLTLWMDLLDGKGALQASLLIRSQEALGRLRRLSLGLGNAMWYCVKDNADAYELLGTVITTSRLEELSITGFRQDTPSILAGLHRSFPGASLKSFQHDPRRPEADPFCQFILSTHAATLESVDLGEKAQTSPSTATLLAGMPNLRSLRCGMMPGLEAVAGCELLRDLDLCVAYEGEARAAAEFLRRATQVVKLTLRYDETDTRKVMIPAPSPDVDFMLALGANGRSRLEELTVYVDIWEHNFFPQEQALLKALPRLPALKLLNVEARTKFGLLLGIRPANAPSLRTLQVFCIGVKCSHDARHRGVVQKFLFLNPELKFITYAPLYCFRDERCAWCFLGCHQEMRNDSDPKRVDYVSIPQL